MRNRNRTAAAVSVAVIAAGLTAAPSLAARPYDVRVAAALDTAGSLSTTSAVATCTDRVLTKRLRAGKATKPRRLQRRCDVDLAVLAEARGAVKPAAMAKRLRADGAFADALGAADALAVAAVKRRNGAWRVVAAAGLVAAPPTTAPSTTPPAPSPGTPPLGASQPPVADDSSVHLLDHTNAERVSRGLPALLTDDCLMRNAAAHARAMAGRGGLYHQTLADVRAECALTGALGENVLWNQVGTGAYAVAQWMGSPGHRANILDPGYAFVGIAQHHDPATGRYYAVQVFAGGAASQ